MWAPVLRLPAPRLPGGSAPAAVARWWAGACLRLARHRLGAGEYAAAQRWAQRALTAAGRWGGSRYAGLGEAVLLLADIGYARGDYRRAETLAQWALRVLTARGGPAPQAVAVLVRLADLARVRARYAAAGAVLRQAAAVAATQPDALLLARVRLSHGVLLKETARYDEAEEQYRLALADGPADGPLAPALWHNLAGLAHARGRYDDGVPAAERAVTLRASLAGPDHPDVARDLTVLAALRLEQGRTDDAEDLYQRARTIFTDRLGPDHEELAVVGNGLATVAQRRGRPAEAERWQRAALVIRRRVLGPDHPDVALLLHNLAVSLRGQGRYPEADDAYREALAILERTVSPEHPLARACRVGRQQCRPDAA